VKVSHNNLVYSLGRLRHLAHRFIEREMERRGIEGMAPSFGDVFMIVAARGPLPMKEIARLTYKDKSTITGVVRALEKAGYLSRSGDPADGRAALVSITPEAVKITPALRMASTSMNERLLDGLSERDCRTLFRLLGRLGANLKSALSESAGARARGTLSKKGERT